MSNYDIDMTNAVEAQLADIVLQEFNVPIQNYIVDTKEVDQSFEPADKSVGIMGDLIVSGVVSTLTDKLTGKPAFKLEFDVSGSPQGEVDEDGTWTGWLDNVDVELTDTEDLRGK